VRDGSCILLHPIGCPWSRVPYLRPPHALTRELVRDDSSGVSKNQWSSSRSRHCTRPCKAPWRRSNPDCHRGEVLDCFAEFIIGPRFARTRWLAMTLYPCDVFQRSRGADAPESCGSRVPPRTEGAGKAGCRPHPWPASNKKSWRQLPQVWPNNPAFPARRCYGLYVISLGNRAFLPPSSR